jgi:TRAP-type mannitol/chloroaromatic compound transport system permease small subunit
MEIVMQDSDDVDVAPRSVEPLDTPLRAIELTLGVIAAGFIFALMMFGVAQVVARILWNYPIPGYIDIVELLMAVIAFAAIGYAEQLRAHIRMDFLPGMLRGGRRAALEGLLAFMAMLAVSILVYATWFSFLRSWSLGDSTMDIRAPIWPSKLLLFSALALLWLRLVLSVVGYVRSWRALSR